MVTRDGKYYAHERYAYDYPRETERYLSGSRYDRYRDQDWDRPHKFVEEPPPPPPPLPNDDDAKVARYEQQAAVQLANDITSAGEGGWRSPWYTGPSERLAYSRQITHDDWRRARNEWTKTGDAKHLRIMLNAVDFTNPPEKHEVKLPAPPKRSVWRRALAVLGVGRSN